MIELWVQRELEEKTTKSMEDFIDKAIKEALCSDRDMLVEVFKKNNTFLLLQYFLEKFKQKALPEKMDLTNNLQKLLEMVCDRFYKHEIEEGVADKVIEGFCEDS